MVDDIQAKAAEVMKKVFTVGIGAFFLTEESLRGLITDFKLPKELLNAVLETANKTRGEFLKNLSKEMMAQVIDRVDPSALVQELLAKNEIEITINFKKKTESHEKA